MWRVAPFSKVTSVRHQMMLTDQASSHGSGTTRDWSECRAMERAPGRAMLAVKFEIRVLRPRRARTSRPATGWRIRSRKTGARLSRKKTRTLLALGSRTGMWVSMPRPRLVSAAAHRASSARAQSSGARTSGTTHQPWRTSSASGVSAAPIPVFPGASGPWPDFPAPGSECQCRQRRLAIPCKGPSLSRRQPLGRIPDATPFPDCRPARGPRSRGGAAACLDRHRAHRHP